MAVCCDAGARDATSCPARKLTRVEEPVVGQVNQACCAPFEFTQRDFYHFRVLIRFLVVHRAAPQVAVVRAQKKKHLISQSAPGLKGIYIEVRCKALVKGLILSRPNELSIF